MEISRRRQSESAWGEIVARQEPSGLTVREFCEREGLKLASFYGWRLRLRKQRTDKISCPTKAGRTRAERASGKFIDLGAIDSSRGRFEVRLDLGGGVLLHLVRS